jgi:STE24 endopeptidase
MASLRRALYVIALLGICALAVAQSSSPSPVAGPAATPAAAQPFDVHAAVEAYFAKMPASQRERSNAYFEGGYWLLLWDFVVLLLAMLILLRFRLSIRMRDLAERITRFRWLQTVLYWVPFIVLTTILIFPMTVYESYFREHKYGLLNQTFGPWFRDQAIGLAATIVLGAILMVPLFTLVRRIGKNWWVWGAMVSIAFLAFVSLIAPVYLAPLFNTYTVLQDAHIKDPILSLARANGIPATNVYEFDASRQSDRVSANVSGLGRTMRISLNDNLLKRCTLPEIETTMGHEMGHYVLNHIYKSLVMEGVVVVVAFAFLAWGINFALARWGASWGIRGPTDVAVLPLAVILIAFYSLITTPVGNTITRTMEFEADMYGLNTARQPDGEANVDLLLGEYRKMDPTPIEELLFFDHPSGRTRITAAMQWKAENLETASPEEMARPMFVGKQ